MQLQDRFLKAKTVKGTQQYHRFVPVSKSSLHAYKLSRQEDQPDLAHTSSSQDEEETNPSIDIKEQSFVCCMYDSFPWIGMVDEISDEFGDYHVKFMHPHGPANQFSWPAKEDTCWVGEENILCQINAPSLTSSSSRKYVISDTDEKNIAQVYPQWVNLIEL